MSPLIIALRVVHIASGIFWAGSVFFINTLLGPSLGAAGPAGGKVLTELSRRRFHEVLLVTSTLAVLSGISLLWLDSGGLSHLWLRSPLGLTLSIGGMAAITAFLVGLVVVRPLSIRLEEVQSAIQQAGTEALRQSHQGQLGQIRGRLTLFGRLAGGCLGVAVLAMATARYL